MKTIGRAFTCFIALAVAALGTSCGSGSGSATGTAGTGTTVSKGVIERFGSVVVNGVEFRVTGAKLHLRDDKTDKMMQNEAEIRNNLEEGMVITVKGKLDDNGLTGIANEIEFRDAMKGRIDAKGADFIRVMGQNIVLDDSIKPLLATLAVNDDVSISAVADDRGGLRAFNVKHIDNPGEFEAKGFVSALSGTTMTLLFSPTATSGLTIDLSTAQLPATGIKDGDFVEVKSAVSSVNGVIIATRVEIEDEIKALENENAEVEGFVANLTSSGFMIGATQVALDSATIFRNGVAADLGEGVKVEAEGNIVNGILVARKITFKDNLRIKAQVTAVDSGGSTLTILGKNVSLPSNLVIRENGNLLATSALVGRFVDLRGRVAADGLTLSATRVDVKNNDPGDAELRGPVSAISAVDNTLAIAGITVSTAGAEFKGSAPDHGSITAAGFFGSIVPNVTVVKVRWRPFVSTAAPASDVELES